MKAPDWYKRLPRWQRKAIDQVLHTIAGGVISGVVGGVLALWIAGGLAGALGALVGTAAGGIREAAQNLGDPHNDTAGNWLDFGVWATSANVVGIFVGVYG